MAATAPNTILLRVNERDGERPIYEDAVDGGATVTPGEFLVLDGGDIEPHGTAAGSGFLPMVAVENIYKTVSGTKAIDTTYAATELCRYVIPQRGDKVYAWIEAGNAAVVEGAALESGASGNLQTATTGQVLAYAAEAVDNSGGGSRVRIRVTIA